ncbi:MAG: hypothetical protein Q9195_005394 [Heterodermia aff. obscurata]
MFCLPYPPNSTSFNPPIEVPYVAKYEYDVSLPNLFENFARECRFDGYDNVHPDQIASLMQSWLVFGLISEIVGKRVDHEVFVRSRTNSDGQTSQFIDSRLDGALEHLVTDRFLSLRTKSQTQREIVWSKTKELITSAGEKALVFEKPDMDVVKNLIKAGEIPLMQLKKSSRGDSNSKLSGALLTLAILPYPTWLV